MEQRSPRANSHAAVGFVFGPLIAWLATGVVLLTGCDGGGSGRPEVDPEDQAWVTPPEQALDSLLETYRLERGEAVEVITAQEAPVDDAVLGFEYESGTRAWLIGEANVPGSILALDPQGRPFLRESWEDGWLLETALGDSLLVEAVENGYRITLVGNLTVPTTRIVALWDPESGEDPVVQAAESRVGRVANDRYGERVPLGESRARGDAATKSSDCLSLLRTSISAGDYTDCETGLGIIADALGCACELFSFANFVDGAATFICSMADWGINILGPEQGEFLDHYSAWSTTMCEFLDDVINIVEDVPGSGGNVVPVIGQFCAAYDTGQSIAAFLQAFTGLDVGDSIVDIVCSNMPCPAGLDRDPGTRECICDDDDPYGTHTPQWLVVDFLTHPQRNLLEPGSVFSDLPQGELCEEIRLSDFTVENPAGLDQLVRNVYTAGQSIALSRAFYSFAAPGCPAQLMDLGEGHWQWASNENPEDGGNATVTDIFRTDSGFDANSTSIYSGERHVFDGSISEDFLQGETESWWHRDDELIMHTRAVWDVRPERAVKSLSVLVEIVWEPGAPLESQLARFELERGENTETIRHWNSNADELDFVRGVFLNVPGGWIYVHNCSDDEVADCPCDLVRMDFNTNGSGVIKYYESCESVLPDIECSW